MSTKQAVLEMLEVHRGKHLSGAYIALQLKVSRNVVWRAIKALKSEGYCIEAVTNKGYCLADSNDIISAEGIKPFLRDGLALKISVHNEIDSTNRAAKVLAVKGEDSGMVIISNCQSSGKGRYGRDFFSPSDTGLYMSAVLRPSALPFQTPTAITAYAGLCVLSAVKAACGISLAIKWVNDIMLDGKKAGGILTEGITDFESGSIQSVIIGIGLNISTPATDFPEAFSKNAVSLYPDGAALITRNQIAAEILNHIYCPIYTNEADMFEAYKDKLMMLGRPVTVIQGENQYRATPIGINATGQLIVQLPEGTTHTLISGEIKL